MRCAVWSCSDSFRWL